MSVTYTKLAENFATAQQINRLDSLSGTGGFCTLIGLYEATLADMAALVPNGRMHLVDNMMDRVRLVMLETLNREMKKDVA